MSRFINWTRAANILNGRTPEPNSCVRPLKLLISVLPQALYYTVAAKGAVNHYRSHNANNQYSQCGCQQRQDRVGIGHIWDEFTLHHEKYSSKDCASHSKDQRIGYQPLPAALQYQHFADLPFCHSDTFQYGKLMLADRHTDRHSVYKIHQANKQQDDG